LTLLSRTEGLLSFALSERECGEKQKSGRRLAVAIKPPSSRLFCGTLKVFE